MRPRRAPGCGLTLHNVHYRQFTDGVGLDGVLGLSRLTEHVESQPSRRKACRVHGCPRPWTHTIALDEAAEIDFGRARAFGEPPAYSLVFRS